MLCTPLGNDVDNHVANGANPSLQHVDVQAEELTDLQAGAHFGAEYSAKNSAVAAMDLIVMVDLAKFALDLVSANRPGYTLGSDSGSVPNSLPSLALTSVPTTSTQVDTRQHRVALVSVLLQPQATALLDLVCQQNLLPRTQKLFQGSLLISHLHQLFIGPVLSYRTTLCSKKCSPMVQFGVIVLVYAVYVSHRH
jgi:hypothetical protein